MDKDDWFYAGGVLLIAVGAGVWHVGAGIACAGLGMVFPCVLSLLRGQPPNKGADS